MTSYLVNGLILPRVLADLLVASRWVAPDESRIERVFGEKPSHARFYSLEDMRFENQSWRAETSSEYLGQADDRFPPGDLDPGTSVLIGDLGHDLPFALDYRDNAEDPRVVFLGTRVDGRWITVAENVAELIAALGLA